MHLYLFDYRLQNRKYKRLLNQLDLQLSSLGITGEIIYLKKFEDAKILLMNITKYKPLNIIIVGDDSTFLRTAHLILKDDKIRKNSAIGFMPLLGSQRLAKLLGIPEKLEAVRVISRRITKNVNLSRVNSYLFFSRLKIKIKKRLNFQFLLNKSFLVSSALEEVLITVFDPLLRDTNTKNLTLLLLPPLSFWERVKYKKELENENFSSLPRISIFKSLKEIKIKSPENIPLYLNNQPFINTPCTIKTTNQYFKVIVGRKG